MISLTTRETKNNYSDGYGDKQVRGRNTGWWGNRGGPADEWLKLRTELFDDQQCQARQDIIQGTSSAQLDQKYIVLLRRLLFCPINNVLSKSAEGISSVAENGESIQTCLHGLFGHLPGFINTKKCRIGGFIAPGITSGRLA